jgi:hypothetical protein
MSHGITNNDQMFSVRHMPWHGRGVVLDEYPRSIEEALDKAGRGWKVPTATCSWSRRPSGPTTSGPSTRPSSPQRGIQGEPSPPIKRRLTQAWQETDHAKALEQLCRLAVELEHEHPGAAAALREGMEETLTVTRLGITGKLKRTLQSTNPCESMIGTVRTIQRNVKNWSSGEMCLRWTAAGMLEAAWTCFDACGRIALMPSAGSGKSNAAQRSHSVFMGPAARFL